MAERYTRLFSLSENLYTTGAPVVIAAGALLKDNQTGKTLAQIKFKSISEKQIKAVKISVSAFDVAGKELEGVAEYQYLDLTATRNSEFGQKQAVPLPDAVTRSFEVKCTDVVFGDGTVWNALTNAKWLPLPTQASITSQLGDLAAQYQRDTSPKSKFIPLEYEDLWRCSCGEINRNGEYMCHSCRNQKEQMLAALDIDALQQRKLDYEQAQVEQERASAEAAAKKAAADKVKRAKTMKLAAVAVLVVVLALLATELIIPTIRYNKALAVMEAGRYQEAEQLFIALGDFKDSEGKSVECYKAHEESEKRSNYNNAIALMNAGEYEKAISAFSELANYEDSAERIEECKTAILDDKYNDAVALMDEGKYEEAITAFEELGNYGDSSKKINECNDAMLDIKSVNIGDCIFFGTYEQDNNNKNGKDPVEWRVLDIQDGMILVISEYGLDGKCYNEIDTDVTWETCTLRTWLNNEFLSKAFSDEEKAMIATIKVSAEGNSIVHEDVGASQYDKVFLLSIMEAEQYFDSDIARKCEITPFTMYKYLYNDWWLCTPGVDDEFNSDSWYDGYKNTYVDDRGCVQSKGYYVNKIKAVRPAMWIDLSKKS